MADARVWYRCTKPGRRPVVAAVTVRAGVVVEAAPALQEYVGARWHVVRPELEAARWTCEERDADDV